jgi:hypothetical protein
MPKGVKASPTAKAVAMLERERDKIKKRLVKYDQLRRDLASVEQVLAALNGRPFQGVDGGGVNHVTVGRKAS